MIPKYLTKATGIDERGSSSMAKVYSFGAKCDYKANYFICTPLEMFNVINVWL